MHRVFSVCAGLLLVASILFLSSPSFSNAQDGGQTPVITAQNLNQLQEVARIGWGQPSALAYSPDGQTVAVAGGAGIVLLDPATLEETRLLDGFGGPVVTVDWSADGRLLLGGSQDGSARLFDVSSGEQIAMFEVSPAGVRGAVLSPDGSQVATIGEDNVVTRWLVEGSMSVERIAEEGTFPTGLAFSPDGQNLLIGSSAGMMVRNLATGDTRDYPDLRGPVVFSPDGQRVASGKYNADSMSNDLVVVWDFATGEELSAGLVYLGVPASIAWSPDGSRLVVATEAMGGGLSWMTAVLDATSGELLGDLVADEMLDVTWTPDGTHILSVEATGTLSRWDSESFEMVWQSREMPVYVTGVEWSPDGSQLATAETVGFASGLSGGIRLPDFTTVRVHDGASLALQQELRPSAVVQEASAGTVSWSPDGRFLGAAGQGGMAIWETDTWQGVAGEGDYTLRHNTLAWAPDGSLVAGAREIDEEVGELALLVVEPSSDPAARYEFLSSGTERMRDVAWSADGRWLAMVTSEAGSLRVWDASADFTEVVVQEGAGLFNITFSPDSAALLTLTQAGGVTAIDPATGDHLWAVEDVARMERQFPRSGRAVQRMALHPDGSLLAVLSGEQEVVLVDLANQMVVGSIWGQAGGITQATFNPAGNLLATAGFDGSLRLWAVVP